MSLSFKQFQDLLCKNGCGFMAGKSLQGYCPKCWADKCLPSVSGDQDSNKSSGPNLSSMTHLPRVLESNKSNGSVNTNSGRKNTSSNSPQRERQTDDRTGASSSPAASGKANSEKEDIDDCPSPSGALLICETSQELTPTTSTPSTGRKLNQSNQSNVIGERDIVNWEVVNAVVETTSSSTSSDTSKGSVSISVPGNATDKEETVDPGTPARIGSKSSEPAMPERERSLSPDLIVLEDVKKPEPELITIEDTDEPPPTTTTSSTKATPNRLSLITLPITNAVPSNLRVLQSNSPTKRRPTILGADPTRFALLQSVSPPVPQISNAIPVRYAILQPNNGQQLSAHLPGLQHQQLSGNLPLLTSSQYQARLLANANKSHQTAQQSRVAVYPQGTVIARQVSSTRMPTNASEPHQVISTQGGSANSARMQQPIVNNLRLVPQPVVNNKYLGQIPVRTPSPARTGAMEVVASSQKLQCDRCDKEFYSLWSLNNHKLVHERKKCRLCNRGFQTQAALTTHEKSHLYKSATKSTSSPSRTFFQVRQVTVPRSTVASTSSIQPQQPSQQGQQPIVISPRAIHVSPQITLVPNAQTSTAGSTRPGGLVNSGINVTKTVITTQASKGTHVVVETRPVATPANASQPQLFQHIDPKSPIISLQPQQLSVPRPSKSATVSITASTTSPAISSNSSLWADWRKRIVTETPMGDASFRLASLASVQSNARTSSPIRMTPVSKPPLPMSSSIRMTLVSKPPQPTRLQQIFPQAVVSNTISRSVSSALAISGQPKTPFAGLIAHLNNQTRTEQNTSKGTENSRPSKRVLKKPVRRLNRRPKHKCHYCMKNFCKDVRHFRNHLWMHRQKYRSYWYMTKADDNTETSGSNKRPVIGRRPFMLLYPSESKKKKRSVAKRPPSSSVVHKLPNVACGYCSEIVEVGDALVQHENEHFRLHNRPKAHCSVCNVDISWTTSIRKHAKCQSHKTKLKLLIESLQNSPGPAVPKPMPIVQLPSAPVSSSSISDARKAPRKQVESTPEHLKVSLSKSKSNRRLTEYEKERPYSCKRCGVRFKHIKSARKHNRGTQCAIKHMIDLQNKKPSPPKEPKAKPQSLKCVYCDAVFIHKTKLTDHELMHTRENLYKHMCDVCGASFARKEVLAIHKHVHDVEMLYSCSHCNARFSKDEDLKDHQRQKHPDIEPYGCVQCNDTFICERDLVDHVQTAHGSRKSFAKKSTGGTSSSEKSSSGKRSSESFAKKSTGGISSSGKSLSSKTSVSGKSSTLASKKSTTSTNQPAVAGSFGCLYCGNTYKDRNQLVIHQKTHNSSNPQKDTHSINSAPAATNIHQKTQLSSDPQKDNSSIKSAPGIANVREKSQHSTKSQKQTTTPISSALAAAKSCHICLECGREFRNQQGLASHIGHVHRDRMHTKFVCKICSKSFQNNSGLLSHERSHTNTPKKKSPAKAPIQENDTAPNELFSRSGVLKRILGSADISAISDDPSSEGLSVLVNPMIVDGGSLDTNKDIISSSDSSSSSSGAVKEVTNKQPDNDCNDKESQETGKKHRPPRKLRNCKYCSKLCLNEAKLKLHMKSHTEYRPYKCTHCIKRFREFLHLKEHKASHLPYICDVCETSYVTYEVFVNHAVDVHGDSKENFMCTTRARAEVKSDDARHQPYDRGHRCIYCKRRFCRETRRVHLHLKNHLVRYKRFRYRGNKSVKKTKGRVDENVIGNVLLKTLQTSVAGKNQTEKTQSKISTISDKSASISDQNKPKYECFCGKKYTWKKSLIAHEKQHKKHEILKKQSREKEGVIITSDDKKIEEKVVEDGEKLQGEVPYRCKDCGQSFTLWRLREEHIRRVHKNFTCQYCDKAFLVYQILMRHEKKHKQQGDPMKKQTETTTQQNSQDREGICKESTDIIKVKNEQSSSDSSSSDGESDGPEMQDASSSDSDDQSVQKKSPPKVKLENEGSEKAPAKSYKCEKCDRSFRMLVTLLHHAKIHDKKKVVSDYSDNIVVEGEYKCKICVRSFVRAQDLAQHSKSHKKKRYQCERCPRSFDKFLLLLRHNKRTHPGNKVVAPGSKDILEENQTFMCQICFEHFPNKAKMMEHKSVHSRESKFSCGVCSMTFNQSWDLIVHKRTHTREELRLSTGGHGSTSGATSPALPVTVDDESTSEPSTTKNTLSCSFCGFVCTDEAHLALHAKTHTSESMCTCTFCGKVYKDNDDLLVHLKDVHYTLRTSDEETCGESSNKKSTNLSDEPVSSGDDGDVGYDDLGGFGSDSDSEVGVATKGRRLRTRATKPAGAYDETYQDEDDQFINRYPKRATSRKSYTEPGDLRLDDVEQILAAEPKEKRSTVVDEPFKCSYCGIGFTLENDWSFHEYQHAENKPYRCKFCYRMFTRRSNLVQHERSHRGKKPYRCVDCGNQFAMESHLKHHREQDHSTTTILTHMKQENHKCATCGKGFIKHFNLMKHQENCLEAPLTNSGSSSTYIPERNAAKLARLQISVNRISSDTDGGDDDNDDVDDHVDNDDGEHSEISNVQSDKDSKAETDTDTIYKCRFCPKIFPIHRALIEHESGTHKARGPIECRHCGLGFWFNSGLKRHEAIHNRTISKPSEKAAEASNQVTKIKPIKDSSTPNQFECHLCHRMFSSQELLKTHEQTHKQQQSFKCKYCLKTFQYESDLAAHEKSHTAPAPTTSFGCLFCHEMFTLKSALIDHIQTHSGRESYMCPHCDLTFPTSATLQAHEKEHFKTKSTYQCTHCQALFNDKEKLVQHEATHRGNKFYCKYCKIEFLNKAGLCGHMKIHEDQVPASSAPDDYPSVLIEKAKQATLQPIIRLQSLPKSTLLSPQHHGVSLHTGMSETETDPAVDAIVNPYSCNVCKQSFANPEILKKHVRTHAKGQAGTCTYCGKEFTKAFMLRAHLRLHLRSLPNPDSKGTFKCQVCGIDFRKKSALISHMKTHVNKVKAKPFSFHKPSKSFHHTSKSKQVKSQQVVQNQKNTHSDPRSGPSSIETDDSICHYCHRTFYDKYKVLRHIEVVHSKDRPHKCEKCGFRYTTDADLSRHMKSHEGNIPKPHGCKVCGNRFVTRSTLNKHMRLHTDKCDECDITFPNETTLINHMKTIHDKLVHPKSSTATEKEYVCDICDCKFSHKVTLTRHLQTHSRSLAETAELSNSNPYKCNTCGSMFAREKYLRRHRRNVHSEKLPRKSRMVTDTMETPPRKRIKNDSATVNSPKGNATSESPNRKRIKMDSPAPSNPKGNAKAISNSPKTKSSGGTSSSDTSPNIKQVNKAKTLHECKYCTLMFVELQDLIRHERSHPGEKPYSCEDCSKSFYKRSHLTNHRAKVHCSKESQVVQDIKGSSSDPSGKTRVGEKKYPCLLCQKTFDRPNKIRAHMDKCHSDDAITDDLKEMDQSKDKTDAEPYSATPQEKRFHCSKCDKSYFKEKYLKVHFDKHHKIKTETKTAEGSNTLKMSSEPRERPFACSSCDKRYYKETHLKDHYERVHQPKESKSSRDEEVDTSTELVRERLHSCNMCNKRYYKRSHLNDHYNRVHKPKEENTLPTSSTTIPDEPHLEATQQQDIADGSHPENSPSAKETASVKPRENTFFCSKCDKSYFKQKYLNVHYNKVHKPMEPDVLKHEEDSEVKEAAATTKNTSKPREKKFGCSKCDKRYYTNSHLKDHYDRIHKPKEAGTTKQQKDTTNMERSDMAAEDMDTKSPPTPIFPCNICRKRYPTKSRLEAHVDRAHKATRQDHKSSNAEINTQSKEKRFSCTKCNKSYYKMSHLLHHNNKYHAPKEPQFVLNLKSPAGPSLKMVLSKGSEVKSKEERLKEFVTKKNRAKKSTGDKSAGHNDRRDIVNNRDSNNQKDNSSSSATSVDRSFKDHGRSSPSIKRISSETGNDGHSHKKIKTSNFFEGVKGSVESHLAGVRNTVSSPYKSGKSTHASKDQGNSSAIQTAKHPQKSTSHNNAKQSSSKPQQYFANKQKTNYVHTSHKKAATEVEHRVHSVQKVRPSHHNPGVKFSSQHQPKQQSQPSPAAMYACHICEKTFTVRDKLAIHLQNH